MRTWINSLQHSIFIEHLLYVRDYVGARDIAENKDYSCPTAKAQKCGKTNKEPSDKVMHFRTEQRSDNE